MGLVTPPSFLDGTVDALKSLADYAAGTVRPTVRLGVTETTARTTLKRILAKTGTRRQADLVGLLKSAALPR